LLLSKSTNYTSIKPNSIILNKFLKWHYKKSQHDFLLPNYDCVIFIKLIMDEKIACKCAREASTLSSKLLFQSNKRSDYYRSQYVTFYIFFNWDQGNIAYVTTKYRSKGYFALLALSLSANIWHSCLGFRSSTTGGASLGPKGAMPPPPF
jgi:hypothetical protein